MEGYQSFILELLTEVIEPTIVAERRPDPETEATISPDKSPIDIVISPADSNDIVTSMDETVVSSVEDTIQTTVEEKFLPEDVESSIVETTPPSVAVIEPEVEITPSSVDVTESKIETTISVVDGDSKSPDDMPSTEDAKLSDVDRASSPEEAVTSVVDKTTTMVDTDSDQPIPPQSTDTSIPAVPIDDVVETAGLDSGTTQFTSHKCSLHDMPCQECLGFALFWLTIIFRFLQLITYFIRSGTNPSL